LQKNPQKVLDPQTKFLLEVLLFANAFVFRLTKTTPKLCMRV